MTAPCRLSFIVPFHRNLAWLERCLAALDFRPCGSELIVAADGAIDDCRLLAEAHGAQVITIDGPVGAATARNTAARHATGEVLVFVDADVEVSRQGLARLPLVFADHPQIAAVFGAYDEQPGDPGFMSQYKNLAHSFVHQASATRARTFWTGFGAVRREAFEAIGGFDERLPSVEDIDFGYRLTRAGYQVSLDRALSACHLKRWTVLSTVASDVLDRGIPWTQLILKYGEMADDLNLRLRYRWSVAIAYLAAATLWRAFHDARFLIVVVSALAAVTWLNRQYYWFFYRKRGAAFAGGAWLLHLVHHLYNGLSFATGLALFGAARYLGVRLPGSVPPDAWSAAR